MPQAAPFITAAASVASVASSVNASRANRAYQEKQRQVQIRVDRLNARRQKVAAYREKLQAEAATQQAAIATGSTSPFNSSGYIGGISSLESQFAANQNYVNALNGLTQYSNNIVNKAPRYQSLSSLFSAAGNLAGNTFGGYSELNQTARNMFN